MLFNGPACIMQCMCVV